MYIYFLSYNNIYIAVLLVALSSDALHQVKQQFTRHGLYTADERVVVYVLREEIDGEGEV